MKKKFDMTSCFPGFKETRVEAGKMHAPVPEVTVLENGLTVTSMETIDSTMCSLSFLVNTGSSDEIQTSDDKSNTGGIISLLDSMAFGPTEGETALTEDGELETVSRKLNRIGAIDQVMSSREAMSYFVDVIGDNADRGLELLSDAILRPAVSSDSLKSAVDKLSFKNEYMMAEILSRDAVAMAAYKGTPLGNYHFPTNMLQVGLHTPEKVDAFRRKMLHGGNCVLAGVGLKHSDLVDMAKKHFLNGLPYSPSGPHRRTKSQYVGGLYTEKRVLQEPFVKLALSFEVGGIMSEDIYAICVLEKILGGGSSFSAGGPGKGMYSRLYIDVLNQHHWMESAQSFVLPFEQSGLFGIDASCMGEHVQFLYQVILNEFIRLASDEVNQEELSRSKNMLKSQMMMQLESRLITCEDLARQISMMGKREEPEEICKKIDSVTASDIRDLVRSMLKQPPSIACVGEDLSQVPTYEQLHDFTNTKLSAI